METDDKSLHLNVAPVTLPNVTLPVGVLPFNGKDDLDLVRNQHRLTHIFKRRVTEDRNDVLVLSLDGTPTKLSNKHEDISLTEDLSFSATLLREGFIRLFTKNNYAVKDSRPVQVVTQYEQGDVLAAVLAEFQLQDSIVDWLAVQQMLELDVRIFDINGKKAFLGVTCNGRSHREINLTAGQLIENGLSLQGIYVGRFKAHYDVRLEGKLELLGRVTKAENDLLYLDDCKTEESEVSIHDVHVEASSEMFRRCLTMLFGRKAEQITKKLYERQAHERNGPNKLDLIKRIIGWLKKMKVELTSGVRAEFDQVLTSASQATFPAIEKMPETVYIFDPSSQPQRYKPIGLAKQGPHLWSKFTPNSPKICVICLKRRKGEVEQFIRKLLSGAPTLTNGKNYYENGFWNLYKLQTSNPEFFCVDGDGPQAYKLAVQRALEAQDEQNPWRLALVQMEPATHGLHGAANPYLVTKASFLSQQVPVQGFDIETMNYRGADLHYALSDMSLACYAKLGGTPWVLQCDDTVAHELVVGLGSAIISDSRLSGSKKRVVGITTMFTGGGLYLLGNTSPPVLFKDFQSTLTSTLESSIAKIRKERNWQRGEQVRLIFHGGFKKFKDEEVEAVKKVASSLTDYKVEFAFVEIVSNHPLWLIDPQQEGIIDYRSESKARKGRMAPLRGLYMHLNGRDTLMVVTGPKEVKRASDGLPAPLLLHLHHGSTFHDMTYLARQVFSFSDHSWRTFGATSLPVTISYSASIAYMLGRLEGLWNPDSILGRLRRSRWFL